MAMSSRVVLSGNTSLGSFLATINVYKDTSRALSVGQFCKHGPSGEDIRHGLKICPDSWLRTWETDSPQSCAALRL